MLSNHNLSMQYDGLGIDAKVLLYLSRRGKVVRRTIRDETGISYAAIKTALERMEDVGMTHYEAVGDYRDTVYWSLTEKGEKAAAMLAAVDDFIRNG